MYTCKNGVAWLYGGGTCLQKWGGNSQLFFPDELSVKASNSSVQGLSQRLQKRGAVRV